MELFAKGCKICYAFDSWLQVAANRGLESTRAKETLYTIFLSALPLTTILTSALPSPTPAAPKLAQVAEFGACLAESWHLPGWRFLHCTGDLWQVLNPLGGEHVCSFSWYLIRISLAASDACCLLSFGCVPQKRTWLISSKPPQPLLASLRQVLNPSLSIFSSSWINPAYSLLCSRLLTALVALCWILSSFSGPFFLQQSRCVFFN